MELFLLISGFTGCASLIILGGSKLSKYGDIIAELTGIGKAWFGLIIMAAVTSLPELFTGFSAVVIVDSPEIAVGNIMGSCAFNMLILAILDYFVPKKSLLSLVTKGHLLAVFFSIFLITVSVMAILYENNLPVLGWVGSVSILLIALYLVAIRIIFKFEKRNVSFAQSHITPTIHPVFSDIPLPLAIKRYSLFALMVVVGGIALPVFADELATYSGLNKTFVGTLLVAITTSLPELVVSITAVKIGSHDIAVGNLLGSNIFNMLILSLEDFMYSKGALLEVVNPINALSGLVAILMTAVVGITILYSSPPKRYILGIDDFILIALYVFLIITIL